MVERIDRLRRGLLSRAKSVGGKVSEIVIDHGPGCRVYFTVRDRTIYILLCGGHEADAAERYTARAGNGDRNLNRTMEIANGT